ncbi:MAG: translocation/assembly module TamB domain-containing protein [Halothiobacillaceae bacterium]
MILLVLRLIFAVLGVLLGAGALLLWLVLALALWLSSTTSGLKMLVLALENTGMVQVGQVEGSLFGRMKLDDVLIDAGGTQVHVQCAEMNWQPLELLKRQVQVDRLWLSGVQIELAESAAKDEASPPWQGLSLPIEIFVDDLLVDGVSLRRAGAKDAQPIFAHLNARVSLESTGLHVQHVQLEDLAGLVGSNLNLSGAWSLQPQDALDVAFDWHLPLKRGAEATTMFAGQGQLGGTLEALNLQHSLSAPFTAELEATLAPMCEGLPWTLALQVPPLRLADQPLLVGALPPELAAKFNTLALELDAQGSQGGMTLERLELQQDKAHGLVSGWLGWREGLQWNVNAQVAGLHPELIAPDWAGDLSFVAKSAGQMQEGKPIGTVKFERLHGQLRGYPLEASLDAEIKAWAASLPELNLETLSLRSGASTLAAKGVLGESLALTGRLDSPNLTEFVPQASGRAQANFNVSGTPAAPNVKADVQGQNLGWQAFRLGTLAVQAEGGLQADAAINVALNAKDVRQDDKPVLESLDVDVRGQARAHDLRIELVQGRAAAPLQKRAEGSKPASETEKAQKNTNGLRLNLAAQGAWDGALERLQIQSATLENSPTGSWTSTQPVELVAGADQFTLPKWCGQLTTPPGKATACMQGQWRAGKEGAAARLELSDFNLDGLNAMLKGKPVQLRGMLGGFVALDAPQGAPLKIRAEVDGQDVIARVQTGLPQLKGVPEWRDIALDAARVEASLGGGAGQLAANLGINAANRIEMQVNLPGLNLEAGLPPKQPMQGYVDLRFEDNALLAGFLPMLKEPQGRLAGRLLLAGTLDEPKVSGGVQLVEGRMVLPDLGVRVTEGRMLLRAYASNYLTLEGSALLGTGKATLDGRIDLADFPKWQAQLRVGGENLTVMRLPNASVQASPDLTLQLTPGMQRISGRVDVPQALFDVGGFGAGAVKRSNDVRILGDEPPEPAGVMEADVLLVLGENVRIEGMGFKGRVQGQLRVLDRPTLAAPLGQGELQVLDARYRAYGQDLTIEQGRLMFASSPLSNPGLDIRAVRRQTADDVVVGLIVTGSATTPKIALFSQPSLPQSEMLSYLVTGRSSKTGSGVNTQTMLQIAQAAGLATASDLAENSVARDLGLDELGFEAALGSNDLSLAIGKYLSPRIYLRYLQGLGNGVQDIVLTYDWTRAIQLRGQVGTRASGLDVFYRFER